MIIKNQSKILASDKFHQTTQLATKKPELLKTSDTREPVDLLVHQTFLLEDQENDDIYESQHEESPPTAESQQREKSDIKR